MHGQKHDLCTLQHCSWQGVNKDRQSFQTFDFATMHSRYQEQACHHSLDNTEPMPTAPIPSFAQSITELDGAACFADASTISTGHKGVLGLQGPSCFWVSWSVKHLWSPLQPWNRYQVQPYGQRAPGQWRITHLYISQLVLINLAVPVQLVLRDAIKDALSFPGHSGNAAYCPSQPVLNKMAAY